MILTCSLQLNTHLGDKYAIWLIVAFLGLAIVVINYLTQHVFKLRDLHPIVVNTPRIVIVALMVVCAMVFAFDFFRRNLRPLLSHQNSRLLTVFLLYLMCIPAFGLLYFYLYRRRRSNFMFAASITEDAVESARQETQQEVAAASSASLILDEAVLATKIQGIESFAVSTWTKPSGDQRLPAELRRSSMNEVTYVLWTGDASFAACQVIDDSYSQTLTSLYVGSEGKILIEERFPLETPRTGDEFVALFEETAIRCRQRAERLLRKLATLDSAHPDAWNYLDFFYFSTITQTTVGYGDILPNSTTVRVLVSAQILLGYLIIAVMINFTFFH
jgi:ion channel